MTSLSLLKKSSFGFILLEIKTLASLRYGYIYLKFLIHLVGDIHQPLHTGKFEDRGGNDIKLTFLGKPTNLHIIWDVHMIEYLNMDYKQLSDELMQMKEGNYSLNPDDWVYETHQDVKRL